MKVVLLAAGRGERLRPLTDITPKCLIPVHGIVLLEYWLKLFKKHNIQDIIINTNYLSDKIYDYIMANHPNDFNWTITYEPILLGSASTLLSLRYELTDTFLVCNADNVTNINLTELIKFHKLKHGLMTMALMDTKDPSSCGIVGLDEDHRISYFKEKPAKDELLPPIYAANAGIYIMEPQVLNFIPSGQVCDIGKDLIPNVPNKYGTYIDGVCFDIGTLQRYKEVEELHESY